MTPGPHSAGRPSGPHGAGMPPGPNGMVAPPAARAAASVRPGAQYGRPDAVDGDFGGPTGYAGAPVSPGGPYGGAPEHHSGEYGDAENSAEYKARRHRPSANDTNVGTLADFANYPGYNAAGEDW